MRITVEEAEELLYDDSTVKQYDGRSRWSVQYMLVFERDGKHWGVDYSEPATEYQEGQDRFDTKMYYDEELKRWVDSGEVECYPVEEREFTQWVPVKAG